MKIKKFYDDLMLNELEHSLDFDFDFTPLPIFTTTIKSFFNSLKNDFDFYEDDENYYLEYNIAGFNKDELNIYIDEKNGDKIIKIKANKKIEKNDKENKKYFVKGLKKEKSVEFYYTLPDNIDLNNIKSKLENGILKITFPKTKENEKEIKINVE